jgi:hypothetical protein
MAPDSRNEFSVHVQIETPHWNTKIVCSCGEDFTSRCEFWKHGYEALLTTFRVIEHETLKYVSPSRPAEKGWCTTIEDEQHCDHWWDCEGPCCGCGFDGGGEDCDCPKHQGGK